MANLQNYLIELADKLDQSGRHKSANAVDNLIKTASLNKVAQYVGVIGYVLKQERAVSNCVRRKRAKTGGSMQDIVLSCLKEYQDGQDYHNDEWTSKYAQVVGSHPDLFKESHLSFLSELGQEWGMENHINAVREAVGIFREEQVDEEKINMILSHIDLLGDILRKEAVSTRPFKVAAPSRRSWWSRFLTPGKENFSPFGWGDKGKRRRRYGDDLDLMSEIQFLAQKISHISTQARAMRIQIQRIQRDSRNLVQETQYYSPENLAIAQKVKQTIEGLDPTNWDQTSQQILELAREIHGQKTYNARVFNKAIELAKQLSRSRMEVDDAVDDIYASMHSLRTHEAMMGTRPYGAKNQGEVIANEYMVLGQVIDGIAENPLDLRGHDLALRQINRLNDSLVSKPGDVSPVPTEENVHDFELHRQIQNWLEGDVAPAERDKTTTDVEVTPGTTPSTPSTPSTAAPSAPFAPTPTPAPAELDLGQASAIAHSITERAGDIDSAATALRELSMSNAAAGFTPLIDAVLDQLDAGRQSTKQVMPEEATEDIAVPEESPTKDSPSVDILNAENLPSAPEPVEQGTGHVQIPDDLQIRRRREWEQASTQNEMLAKIADAIDPITKDLADVIDKYIEEHGDVNLPKLPEFGVLLKEKEG